MSCDDEAFALEARRVFVARQYTQEIAYLQADDNYYHSALDYYLQMKSESRRFGATQRWSSHQIQALPHPRKEHHSMKKMKTRPAPIAGAAVGSALLSALSYSAIAAEPATTASEDTVVVTDTADRGLDREDSTATKMDISLKDTGRSVTNLDADDLDDMAIGDVRDAFNYVAGFRANGPADRTFTARGIRTSIDNVMVNGLRSLQGGEAGTGSRLPSTFNAESTTFLRGPEGLLYGAGVGGGIVNVTTKTPQDDAETTVGLETRSYVSDDTGEFERNQLTLNLDSTGPLGDFASYRLLAQTTPGGDHFQNNREVDEQLIDAAVTFKVGENTRVTPRFESTERERTGGSGYADGVFSTAFENGSESNYGKPINRGEYYGSPDDMGENSSRAFDLLVEHDFGDWGVDLRVRDAESESESRDLYISDSSSLGNTLGEDTINRKWVFAKGEDTYTLVDLSFEGKFESGQVQHHLLGGFNLRDMEVKFDRNFQSNDDAVGNNAISASNPSDQIYTPIPAELTVAEYSPRQEEDTNIYLRDRMQIGSTTLVLGLARVEQSGEEERNDQTYKQSFSETIWDIGVIQAINDDLNVFATYSRSFDPVSARWIAQYGQGKTDYEPQEGDNYEIGFKGEFLDRRLSAGLTLYELSRNNATRFERIDGAWHLLQDSGTGFKSKGVEIDATWRHSRQFTSRLSYAYTDAADTKGEDKGRQADNTPYNSVALWNSYQLPGKPVRVALGLRGEGSRKDGNYRIPGYMEADFGTYYETPDWDFGFVVRNLLDKNRVEAGANWVTVQPNEPRSVNMSFKYRF